MEKISIILLILTIAATIVQGDDVIEENVAEEVSDEKVEDLGFSFGFPGKPHKPPLEILIHHPHPQVPPPHPPPPHPSPPPHHPSPPPPPPPPHHPSPPPPPPPCKTYPDCNPQNSSCCDCKNDLRKCCADGSSSSSEGYCLRDSCLSCVKLGYECWHNKQCCGESAGAASCKNGLCCIDVGKSPCTDDEDCCQPSPFDAIWGARCSSSNTCVACKLDYQSCSVATDCCGESICGNTVSSSLDYNKIGICCLPPGSDCAVGFSVCCDNRDCPASESSRYFCKPNPIGSGKKEIDEDKSGWGSSGGGWNSNGWQSGSNGNGLPPGLSSGGGYPLGKCTLCQEYSTCQYDTDCCNGFTCRSTQCRSILTVNLNVQRIADDDENLQQLES